MADAPQLKLLNYDSRIARLVADKKIEIEFDDHLAWLTIVDANQCVEDGPISELLDSVLATFHTAGLIGESDLCHYCQKENVSNLSVSEGKVAQICRACLDERLKKKERDTAAPTNDAVPIFLMTPFAAVVGALLWAGCWIAYRLMVGSVNSEVIVVPRLLVGIVMVLIGLTVGGPVGWIIKQNRRRGGAVSTAAAILFSLLAVFGGEVAYILWVIYREFQVISFSAAVRVMPVFYENCGLFLIAMKIFAAVIAVALACDIATPKKIMLKL